MASSSSAAVASASTGTTTKPMDENGEHILERSWSLWVHKKTPTGGDYSKALVHLGDFNTAEQFWKYMQSMPNPSEILYTTESGYKTTTGGEIEGFSIFVKGIKPEWEDKGNANGGEMHLRISPDPAALDKMWMDLTLALIGENIDPIVDNEICGIRLVDKSRTRNPTYRFEVWYKTKSGTEEVKDRLNAAIGKHSWDVKKRS